MGESRMNKFDEIDVEEDEDTAGESSEGDTEETPETDRDKTGDKLRDRKAIAMYLPDEVREDLTAMWHRFASENPEAQKNRDFFTEVVRRGLDDMEDDL